MAWPYAEDMTADFVYLRLHGSEELYASGYSDEALDHWAARIKLWARGLEPNDARLIAPEMKPPRRNARDVYVYFDNDAKVRAPADARSLRAKLAEFPCHYWENTGKNRIRSPCFARKHPSLVNKLPMYARPARQGNSLPCRGLGRETAGNA